MGSIEADAPQEVSGGTCFTFPTLKSASVFNLIRHAAFKDVAVLATDTVTFLQYDGPLEPEMISHRIGQLPLRFRAGSKAAVATFSIDVVSDTKKSGITWVTSADVTCASGDAEVVHYRTPAEKALATSDAGFLIAPLHPGQRMKISFVGRVSTGREATRWVSCHCALQTAPVFALKIETTGAVEPREALKMALQCTADRLQRLADNLD